jgi:hypothetical protein
VLKDSGSIQESSHFSAIAEEFGLSRGSGALRSLYNETKLGDVERSGPYGLCVVLTGALYSVLMKMHEDYKKSEIAATGRSDYSVSGVALAKAAAHFRRMTLRALDYLPPGEISFADYGRAIMAADQASYPDRARERDWIADEFVKRGIVPDRSALETHPPSGGLEKIDLESLVQSGWASHEFANSRRGRRLLGIPADAAFEVEPRLQVSRLYYHRAGSGQSQRETVREVIFKVAWFQEESNRLGPGYGSKRRIKVGTTLSWDRATGQIRVLLTSDHLGRPAEQTEQEQARHLWLQRLADDGLLRVGDRALGPGNRELSGVVRAKVADDALIVQGSARTLHIVEEA